MKDKIICEKCKSKDTYLFAEIRDGINNKFEKTYVCCNCHHRTTIRIK